MGQYHKPVCIDTMETIHPHKLGDGLKLMEFGMSGSGTMAGLALLLAGEGRWAGKRIVIVGDYAESGDIEGIDVVPLYRGREEYDRYVDRYPEEYPLPRDSYPDDISEAVGQMLVDEGILAELPSELDWRKTHANEAYEPSGPDLLVVNFDKNEALDPEAFGDGGQLGDFGNGYGGGTMTALAILLACSNGRGGGDFHGAGAGRWAGDRIGIVPEAGPGAWTDISGAYREAIESAGEAGFLVYPDGSIKRKARW